MSLGAIQRQFQDSLGLVSHIVSAQDCCGTAFPLHFH